MARSFRRGLSDEEGSLPRGRYVALEWTLAAMPGMAVRARVPGRQLYVARAELVLAHADHRALGSPVLNPDPLEQLAATFAEVRTQDGEAADLVVDLLSVADGRVARRRRRLIARATRRGPSAFGEQLEGGRRTRGAAGVWDVLNGTASKSSQGRAEVPRQTDVAEGVGKFVPGAQVFALQVLVRCTARHPARARARLHQVMAALQALRGENRFVPVGPRVGMWRPYSNALWLRGRFDRRFSRGDFAPSRRSWVTWQELAGLLKPPSVHCTAQNVLRTGGVVPPAPAALPTWTGQADVLPLGKVTGPDGVQRMAGAYADEVLFGASFGKSGYGKTEQALVQFAARAYAGDGGWFLDPHHTASIFVAWLASEAASGAVTTSISCSISRPASTGLEGLATTDPTAAFGMDPEATMIYLADHVDEGRLPEG